MVFPTTSLSLACCLLIALLCGCQRDDGVYVSYTPTEQTDEDDALNQTNADTSESGEQTSPEEVSVPEETTNEDQVEPQTPDVSSQVAEQSDDTPTEKTNATSITELVTTDEIRKVLPEEPKRKIKLLVPHQEFFAEGPNGAIRVSYDDLDLLKVLNMEPVPIDAVEYFPDWLKRLEGKRIRIRGFMYPPARQEGISSFILARDNQICCFGRSPKVYDLIIVDMKPGVTTSYIQNRPFDVVGEFHIEPVEAGEELFELYSLKDAIIIE